MVGVVGHEGLVNGGAQAPTANFAQVKTRKGLVSVKFPVRSLCSIFNFKFSVLN